MYFPISRCIRNGAQSNCKESLFRSFHTTFSLSYESARNLEALPIGKRELLKPEHIQFLETCSKFFEKEVVPYHEKWETEGKVSRDVWKKAGQLGLLCVMAPHQYGGMGGDFLWSSLVSEAQARTLCTGPGFLLHSDVALPYISHYGTESVKASWLPKMISGEGIAAIAMTEPSAGSDLQGIKTSAVREGDCFVLNGSKTFITNGYMSDLVIVVARTNFQTSGSKGISLFVVESGMEGFRKGKPLKKVGLKAQDTCELFFDQVRVPITHLLGKENEGFSYLMTEIPQERLSIAVNAMASAETVFEQTLQYVKDRKVFGKTVFDLQTTKHCLAEMKTELIIARNFVDRCIQLHLDGILDQSTAAMAKYWVTQLQNKVADRCVQLYGGYGYMWEYPVAKHFCDARVQSIYGGTNEIMKELIARTL